MFASPGGMQHCELEAGHKVFDTILALFTVLEAFKSILILLILAFEVYSSCS
jgi:hypothetical protein